MEEIDVWRTAHVLMKDYGEEAALIAARRSDGRRTRLETTTGEARA